MTLITREQFEALRPTQERFLTTERDGEYLYEIFLDEDGEEVAFAAYRDGEAVSFTRVDRAS